MMETVEDILNRARGLSPRDRLQIVRDLLLTLESDGEPLSQGDWNAAWLPELEARLAAYERGETEASDWQVVMARLRHSARIQ